MVVVAAVAVVVTALAAQGSSVCLSVIAAEAAVLMAAAPLAATSHVPTLTTPVHNAMVLPATAAPVAAEAAVAASTTSPAATIIPLAVAVAAAVKKGGLLQHMAVSEAPEVPPNGQEDQPNSQHILDFSLKTCFLSFESEARSFVLSLFRTQQHLSS